jgi:FkbM family methyltransferase
MDRRPLAATLPNGCRITCDLRDHIQRHQWFFGAYEPVESYLITRLIRPGMTFIDAGANIGQYTLLASTAVGPSGSVHAFEPIPANFEQLRTSVELNGLSNVHLNPLALWNESTVLRFDLPDGYHDNAGSYRVVAGGGRAGVIEAQAMRLDDHVAENGIQRVNIIKIDVEGAEPFVLEGARATLERDRPLVLMEVNRSSLSASGGSPAALVELFRSLGYRAWRIGHSSNVSGPVENLAEIERANVILHCDDLPAEVTSGWDLRTVLHWARSRR